MSERKNSVEEIRQEFLDKGGIFLGQKEWDRNINGIENFLRKYWKANPMAVDDAQRKHEGELLQDVYLAGAQKTGMRRSANGRKWVPFYHETYVRKDEEDGYKTLVEVEGVCYERPSERAEVVGYLCYKLLEKALTLQEVCDELYSGDE